MHQRSFLKSTRRARLQRFFGGAGFADVEALLILGEYGRKGRRTLLQRLQVDWLVRGGRASGRNGHWISDQSLHCGIVWRPLAAIRQAPPGASFRLTLPRVRQFDPQYANADKGRRERSSPALHPSQIYCHCECHPRFHQPRYPRDGGISLSSAESGRQGNDGQDPVQVDAQPVTSMAGRCFLAI